MSDTNPILTSVESLQIEDSTGVIISPSTEDSSGLITQKVPDVTGAEVLNYFSFNTEGGDFVTTRGTANGQNITALVIDPTTDNKRSIITSLVPVKANAHLLAIEASINIRSQHPFAVMEMSTNEVVTPYTVFGITTLQQITTTLTLTMTSAVDWTIGDWINIAGCADNRLNYPNFCIASISANMLVVTGTVSGEVAIPSLSIGPYSTVGMTAQKRRQLLGQDGYGMRLAGTSATNATFLSKFGANITKATGTLIGGQNMTVGSTAPTFTNGATGQVDIKTTSKYFFRSDSDGVWFGDRGIDTSIIITSRNYFTGVKPGWQKDLYLKFNAISPQSMTRPVAKIVSIVKTGTTTATVTTDAPHGLLAYRYATIKGVRDQANFPNLVTPTLIDSVPTTTTFTIIIGPSATATSYGGSVIFTQGSVDQPGIIAQVGQSLTSDATTQFVTIVGSGTWAGLNIGEYVYLHGFRAITTGADLGYDGAWEVVTLSTTTLVVKPVFNHLLVRVSPVFTTLGTTNCGGTVILMTTLRSHDSIMSEYSPVMNQIDGQGTGDATKAMPVTVLNTVATTGTTTATVTPPAPTTPYWLNAIASTNGALIITGTSGLASLYATNEGATPAYIKLYNKATAPTVGTDIPEMTIPVPAAVGGVPGVANPNIGFIGFRFALGLGIAITRNAVYTDTTAIGANEVKVKLSRTT